MKNDASITIRIPAAVKEQLQGAADDNGVSLSVLVNYLVEKFLIFYNGKEE